MPAGGLQLAELEKGLDELPPDLQDIGVIRREYSFAPGKDRLQ